MDGLTTTFYMPAELSRAISGMLDKEASKLMAMVGEKLVEREKLFLRHYAQGVSKWPALAPSYVRWKKEHGKPLQIGRHSGEMVRGLTRLGGALQIYANGKKRRLRMVLRKMKDGTNVYNVFQRGRLKGLKFDSANGSSRTVSRKEVSATRTAEWARWRNEGTAGEKFGAFAKRVKLASNMDRRAGEKVSRLSANARPIMFVAPGDPAIVEKVLAEEVAITMKLRGW